MATLSTAVNIMPLEDRVVIEPIEAEATTRGGILLPEKAQQRPQEGCVVAVGPGRRADNGGFIPMDVSVGMRILYGKYTGQEIDLNGTKCLIFRQSDILAVLG